MPYVIRECNTQKEIQAEGEQPPPFGPGFPSDKLQIAAKLVVTGSSFSDHGPDWTKFELFDETGKCIAARSMAGY